MIHINSKQRILATLNHIEPDKVPHDVWLTPEMEDKMLKHLEEQGVDIKIPYPLTKKEYLPILTGADMIKLEYGPALGFNMCKDPEYIDEWGIKWKWVYNGVGGSYTEMIEHPLADIENISEFEMPDYKNPERYKRAKACIDLFGDDYAMVGGLFCTLFELAWFLRGMENVMCDMVSNKDFMHAYLDKLLIWAMDAGKNLIELGIDIIFLGDDFGGQDSMLISPELYREFFKPRYKKLITYYKSLNSNIKIAYHCDGYFYPIINDLIEIGIDALNPIQPKSMDPMKIKKEFGDKIALWGAVENQEIIPFGTVEDVIKETRLRIETLAPGGGFIIGPSHGVQSNTPIENMLAFYDTVKKYGKY